MAAIEDQAAIIAAQAKRIAALERAMSTALTLRSPNGTTYRITVSNAGVLSTTLIP